MTGTKDNDSLSGSGLKMYLSFGIAGVAVGLMFPPAASFFVTFHEGMYGWFMLLAVSAGLTMALVAAVVVRSVISRRTSLPMITVRTTTGTRKSPSRV